MLTYQEFICVGCNELCLARVQQIPRFCLLQGINTNGLKINWIRIDNLTPIDIAREIIKVKFDGDKYY